MTPLMPDRVSVTTESQVRVNGVLSVNSENEETTLKAQ